MGRKLRKPGEVVGHGYFTEDGDFQVIHDFMVERKIRRVTYTGLVDSKGHDIVRVPASEEIIPIGFLAEQPDVDTENDFYYDIDPIDPDEDDEHD